MHRFCFLFLMAIIANSALANDRIGLYPSAETAGIKLVGNTGSPTIGNQGLAVRSPVLPHPISHLTTQQMYEQTKEMLMHSTLHSSLEKYSKAEQKFIGQFLEDIKSENDIQILPITSVAPHFMDEQLEKFKQCRRNKRSEPLLFYTSQYMSVGLGPYVIYDVGDYYFIEAYNYIEDEELSRAGYTFYEIINKSYEKIYRSNILSIIEKPIVDDLCRISRFGLGERGRPSDSSTTPENLFFLIGYQGHYLHLEVNLRGKNFSLAITGPFITKLDPAWTTIRLNFTPKN